MKTYILNSNKDAIRENACLKYFARESAMKLFSAQSKHFENQLLENGDSIFGNSLLKISFGKNGLAKSIARNSFKRCFNLKSLARKIYGKCFVLKSFMKNVSEQIAEFWKSFESVCARTIVETIYFAKSFENDCRRCLQNILSRPCVVAIKVLSSDRAASGKYRSRYISR